MHRAWPAGILQNTSKVQKKEETWNRAEAMMHRAIPEQGNCILRNLAGCPDSFQPQPQSPVDWEARYIGYDALADVHAFVPASGLLAGLPLLCFRWDTRFPLDHRNIPKRFWLPLMEMMMAFPDATSIVTTVIAV